MSISNYIRRISAIWNPSMFQGWGRKTSYFEGWYFKLVAANQQHAIAIIPGISCAEGDHHAFIQVMDGVAKTSEYLRFDITDFSSEKDKFQIAIGRNRFSSKLIELDLPKIKGRIECLNPVAFNGPFWSPGIMGWYSFVPFMQCYHGLVSAHHRLAGELNFNGGTIDFKEGKGYIEKDWGSSFPQAWIWTQCNHYDAYEDLSIMASVAHIPWLGSHFIGFLAIVYFKDRMKIFTTYTKAKMKLNLSKERVVVTFRDRESKLEIEAKQDAGTELIAPQKGAMTGKVNESLQARHEIAFEAPGISIKTSGKMAGLEVGGNSRILLDQNEEGDE
ncbi:MAG: hypothetical protein KDC80_04850 [Saprospiraceae bacterium]|nr:hypothetical protein [Saprospiraceae bacterium]